MCERVPQHETHTHTAIWMRPRRVSRSIAYACRIGRAARTRCHQCQRCHATSNCITREGEACEHTCVRARVRVWCVRVAYTHLKSKTKGFFCPVSGLVMYVVLSSISMISLAFISFSLHSRGACACAHIYAPDTHAAFVRTARRARAHARAQLRDTHAIATHAERMLCVHVGFDMREVIHTHTHTQRHSTYRSLKGRTRTATRTASESAMSSALCTHGQMV